MTRRPSASPTSNSAGREVVADTHVLVFYLYTPDRLTNTALLLHPVSAATMSHFGTVPLADLRDPFDRFILATAVQLRIPLVTADHAITATGATEILW